MKTHTSKKQWLLAALACATLALNPRSNAAVTVTFNQVGANVVATWNGSLAPGNFHNDYDIFSTFQLGEQQKLYALTFGGSDQWSLGTPTSTSLNSSPNSSTGGSYGFDLQYFYFPGIKNALADSSVVDFGTGSAYTMTWSGTTLSSIGAASFNNTLAWTSSAGGSNTVSFTTVPVPEPSAALLGVLGAIGLAAHRRRIV
jgi:MYXO-CTERM domain-containing protein